MAQKPAFRFYADPYAPGGPLELSDATCSLCGVTGIWRYTGNVYTAKTPGAICAQCISDGRVGADLHDVHLDDDVDPDVAEQLLQRTPGVACFNPFDWPVKEGMPLRYVGTGADPQLWALPLFRQAMQAAWMEDSGESLDGPSEYLLLFDTLDSSSAVAVLDLD